MKGLEAALIYRRQSFSIAKDGLILYPIDYN
jgi:hypothetical protein